MQSSPPRSSAAPAWPTKLDLLGVGISPTTYDEAVQLILDAAKQGRPAVVACQAVHAVVTAGGDPELRRRVNSFELVTPDGQPVRWAINWFYRAGLAERVYGPELMLRVCREAAVRGVAIYLYGGTPEVLARLRRRLIGACPGLKIAGSESPPFRALTEDEDRQVLERINASGARLVFVGLGCPKQDHFAYEHRERLAAVQLCVGAAFDFHAGVKPMAPRWMQRHGLEWLFRLGCEPRRLASRYLVTNTLFVTKLAGAIAGHAVGWLGQKPAALGAVSPRDAVGWRCPGGEPAGASPRPPVSFDQTHARGSAPATAVNVYEHQSMETQL
ncbi:MAG TPA: WecB/TagA/CpsF family glycosyltransferase [Pirellulales bacterium]|nr:WecB/TagA/CpsF family glycosyltransferase [Pirellulales bacterium]